MEVTHQVLFSLGCTMNVDRSVAQELEMLKSKYILPYACERPVQDRQVRGCIFSEALNPLSPLKGSQVVLFGQ